MARQNFVATSNLHCVDSAFEMNVGVYLLSIGVQVKWGYDLCVILSLGCFSWS
jgi:hypothetical protein